MTKIEELALEVYTKYKMYERNRTNPAHDIRISIYVRSIVWAKFVKAGRENREGLEWMLAMTDGRSFLGWNVHPVMSSSHPDWRVICEYVRN